MESLDGGGTLRLEVVLDESDGQGTASGPLDEAGYGVRVDVAYPARPSTSAIVISSDGSSFRQPAMRRAMPTHESSGKYTCRSVAVLGGYRPVRRAARDGVQTDEAE